MSDGFHTGMYHRYVGLWEVFNEALYLIGLLDTKQDRLLQYFEVTRDRDEAPHDLFLEAWHRPPCWHWQTLWSPKVP